MIEYCYDFQEDGCLQVKKDYKFQLNKQDDKISFSKENLELTSSIHVDMERFIGGRMTGDLVNSQLANIRHIGFEVTDACNLKCTYCTYGNFYNDYDERTNKQMDIKKAIIFLDFLIDKLHSSANLSSQNEVLISFYGGEPLLNMDFIQEMVEYTQKRQDNVVKFNYGMTTNAVYLKKYFSFLYQYDFRITVSLDGDKENDAHRKFFNGQSSFDIVYKNLKYIQDNFPYYFEKNIQFNSVMHDLNNNQEVFMFFQHEFNKRTRISSLNPTGVNPDMIEQFLKLKQQKKFVGDKNVLAEIEQILDLDYADNILLQNFIFQYSDNVYLDYNELLVDKKKKIYFPTATCIPFSRRIFMTVNNKILPCERIGQQYVLGFVTDSNVEIDVNLIANKYNAFYDYLEEQCRSCMFVNNCSQCMYSISDLGDKNAVCDQKVTKVEFRKYISKNMRILSNKPDLYKRIMEEIVVVK